MKKKSVHSCTFKVTFTNRAMHSSFTSREITTRNQNAKGKNWEWGVSEGRERLIRAEEQKRRRERETELQRGR